MPIFRATSHPFGQLRNEFDRMLLDLARNFSGASPANGGAGGFPAVNMWETEQELFVEAEVPGLNEADLEVLVVGNELTIKGAAGESKHADASYHRRERRAGGFARVIRLPVDVDAGQVQAAMRGGVLEIRLPKAERAKPRKINVTSAN